MADPASTEEVKQKALGELMVSIRQDLISREIVKLTKMASDEFKNLKA